MKELGRTRTKDAKGLNQDKAPLFLKEQFAKMDDIEVWKLFKNGKEEALVFIYRAYVNVLFNYGCQFTTERELVKDTVQEFFIELIRNKHNLGDTDNIKFYLFRSFRRKLMRSLKRESRYIKEELTDNASGFRIAHDPELRYIKDQLTANQKSILKEKFNCLPEKQREALLLYYYEGLSYEEIATLFEMSKVKSARVLIYRAIDNLSKELKEYRDVLLMLTLFLSYLR